MIYIVFLSYGIGQIFYSYEELFIGKNIESSIKEDERAPVLFVRSFTMDIDPFFWGNFKRNENHINHKLQMYKYSNGSGNLTFQQFFSYTFNENIGTLIGLGDPTRYVPLEGLTSTFYGDYNWQERFINLANKAVCIITLPGNTTGLNFELTYIINNGLAGKLFIFTPIYQNRSNIQNKFLSFKRWLHAAEVVKWENFHRNMKNIGYEVQIDEPTQGTVIGFNKNGEQRLLKKNAKFPNEYINIIGKHLLFKNDIS